MNAFPRQPLKGCGLALLSTALVSTNYVTAKYSLNAFHDVISFSLIWIVAATFYSLVIVLVTGRIRQVRLTRPVAMKMLVIGVATGLGMLLGWAGLDRLNPAFVAFLWRFLPVMTIVLGAVFLDERLHAWEFAPIGVMVLGGLISTLGDWRVVLAGTVLCLLSCLMGAVQQFYAKDVITQLHPNVLTLYRNGVGAVVLGAAALATMSTRGLRFDVPATAWLVILTGALLGPCLSILLLFRSYRYWELSRSSIVQITEPLFAIPFSFLFLGQAGTRQQIAGGIVILAGAFWLALGQLRKPQPPPGTETVKSNVKAENHPTVLS